MNTTVAANAGAQNDTYRHLYDQMPSQRVRTLFNIPKIWFQDLSDRKVAIDALSLVVKSLPGIIAVISIVMAFAVGYSYSSITSLYMTYPIFSVSLLIFVGSVSFVFFLNFFLNKKLMIRLANIDHHREFKIRQYVFLTNVKNDRECEYAYRFIVKAKSDFVEHFPAVFSWTGQGTWALHPRNKSFTIREMGKVAGGAKRVDILFDQPMRKNEEKVIEYCICTKSDDQHPTLPHMGAAVVNKKYPAFNTFMIVVFSEEFRAISIYRDYYFGGYAAGRLKNITVSLDEKFTHFWDLRFRVNWAYCIRWEL